MLVGWFWRAVNIFGCGSKLFSFVCPLDHQHAESTGALGPKVVVKVSERSKVATMNHNDIEGPIPALFDLEDYAGTYCATCDAYLKAANELKLAMGLYKAASDAYVAATVMHTTIDCHPT